ncbi:Seryl-tRNA synthetase [Striga asiatica]|uniref:Seryl-tRNA synthetase n=1 Tax=Striga asiatica TaxID=4170 RepID=A0A5A7PET7_STRAF|nr:Seryl-tRNA synthetase [Striga asiatica]
MTRMTMMKGGRLRADRIKLTGKRKQKAEKKERERVTREDKGEPALAIGISTKEASQMINEHCSLSSRTATLLQEPQASSEAPPSSSEAPPLMAIDNLHHHLLFAAAKDAYDESSTHNKVAIDNLHRHLLFAAANDAYDVSSTHIKVPLHNLVLLDDSSCKNFLAIHDVVGFYKENTSTRSTRSALRCT